MSESSSVSRAELERWVATWRAAGPALDRQQREELERLDTPTALAQLADAFALALKRIPDTGSSGLVEQQRCFRRIAG